MFRETLALLSNWSNFITQYTFFSINFSSLRRPQFCNRVRHEVFQYWDNEISTKFHKIAITLFALLKKVRKPAVLKTPKGRPYDFFGTLRQNTITTLDILKFFQLHFIREYHFFTRKVRIIRKKNIIRVTLSCALQTFSKNTHAKIFSDTHFVNPKNLE